MRHFSERLWTWCLRLWHARPDLLLLLHLLLRGRHWRCAAPLLAVFSPLCFSLLCFVLCFVCVFKAGPWTDNSAKGPWFVILLFYIFWQLCQWIRGHLLPWAKVALLSSPSAPSSNCLDGLHVHSCLRHSPRPWQPDAKPLLSRDCCLLALSGLASGLAIFKFFFFVLICRFVVSFFIDSTEPEKPKMMYSKRKEQYWFGVKVIVRPRLDTVAWLGGLVEGWILGTWLRCCLAVPASLS